MLRMESALTEGGQDGSYEFCARQAKTRVESAVEESFASMTLAVMGRQMEDKLSWCGGGGNIYDGAVKKNRGLRKKQRIRQTSCGMIRKWIWWVGCLGIIEQINLMISGCEAALLAYSIS